MKKIFVFAFVLTILLLPLLVRALPSDTAPSMRSIVPTEDFDQLVPCKDNCGYSELVTLIKNIINFLTFYLAIPLATVSIFWGGVLYLWSAATPGKKDQGKKIITTAIWGLVLVLAAQLVVTAVLNFFVKPGAVQIPGTSSVLPVIERAYADAQLVTGKPSVPAESDSPLQILKFGSIRDFILAIIDLAVRVGWPLMVLAIIWTGFLFVKAQGNEGKISEAKNAARYTAIGIAIILGATLIKEILEATIKELVG